MRQLMGERLDGLDAIHVRADRDRAQHVVGATVDLAAGLATQLEAGGPNLAGQGGPEPGGSAAGEQLRAHVGERGRRRVWLTSQTRATRNPLRIRTRFGAASASVSSTGRTRETQGARMAMPVSYAGDHVKWGHAASARDLARLGVVPHIRLFRRGGRVGLSAPGQLAPAGRRSPDSGLRGSGEHRRRRHYSRRPRRVRRPAPLRPSGPARGHSPRARGRLSQG